MRTAETNKNEEIAGRKQAEAKRLRIYRAMRMIGACNRGLVMVTNEIDWLNKLCRVLVEEGGCEPYPKWGRQILSSGWM